MLTRHALAAPSRAGDLPQSNGTSQSILAVPDATFGMLFQKTLQSGDAIMADIETDVLIIGTGPEGSAKDALPCSYGIENMVVYRYR